MTAFDSLSDEVLCNGLINAQNKPTDHAKLEKAVGNYLELSIRSEEGKRLVRSLTNNVRPVERRGKVEAEVHPALQRGFNPLNAKSILDSNLAKELKKTQVKGEAEPTKSDAPLQPVDSRKRGKPTRHSTSPSPGKYSSESR
jgi:regulator of protease activity HflC (stomatin/prohibitin superfamily)